MYEKQKIDKELENIRKFSILTNMEEKALKSVSLYFSRIKVTRHQVIYDKGFVSDFVYFIDKGLFSMTGEVHMNNSHRVTPLNPFQIQKKSRLEDQQLSILELGES